MSFYFDSWRVNKITTIRLINKKNKTSGVVEECQMSDK